MDEPHTSASIVAQCEQVMAHAWMVRTFVKHSEEAEEFPELMPLARTVFDVARALETRLDDPSGYFRMLRKKVGRLGKAADTFRNVAPEVSGHMNFRQAVVSMDACVVQLRALLTEGEQALARERQTTADTHAATNTQTTEIEDE
jgi:hypothetical protein